MAFSAGHRLTRGRVILLRKRSGVFPPARRRLRQFSVLRTVHVDIVPGDRQQGPESHMEASSSLRLKAVSERPDQAFSMHHSTAS